MKQIRFDDPKSNPRLQADAKRQPRRDHRAVRADAADPIKDAQDRTAARRGAALDGVRDQFKRRRGATRDDMREGPAKPQDQPTPSMTASDAAEAIRAQSRRTKA